MRGALKTDGHSVVAVNGPPGIVDAPQIASTDAVTVGEGFAGRRSGSWDELFRYFDTAVDRDSVVVVERDEFAESQRTGERADLVRDALHHAAVADEDIGVVIDDVEARAIELAGEKLFGESHADRIGETLPERDRIGTSLSAVPCITSIGSLNFATAAGKVSIDLESSATVRAGSLPW